MLRINLVVSSKLLYIYICTRQYNLEAIIIELSDLELVVRIYVLYTFLQLLTFLLTITKIFMITYIPCVILGKW